ncbi:hypothetical protein ACHWQZ_G004205 [Mnemiopsis leidyi]
MMVTIFCFTTSHCKRTSIVKRGAVGGDELFNLVDGLKDKPSAELKARVFEKIGDYLCAIKDPTCAGEKAIQIEATLVQDGINCDDTPDDELCATARRLVQYKDGSLKDEDLKLALLALAAESFEKMDGNYFSALRQISVALNNFVCQRESGECEFWRKHEEFEKELEDGIMQHDDKE